MTRQNVLWTAVIAGVIAGSAWADPVRTVFSRENKFPGALGVEVSLESGGSTFDATHTQDDRDWFYVAPGVRFGITDRFAIRMEVPYNRVATRGRSEHGIGDILLGGDFLFFEDIFEYAWIVPHASVRLPTGSENRGLGMGKEQARFGLSAGTTVEDVYHFSADVSFTTNGSLTEDEKGLFSAGVGLIWELDPRASLLVELQFRDDTYKADKDLAVRYLGGLVYRVNRVVSLMGYIGSSTGLYEDVFGMGRVVFQF